MRYLIMAILLLATSLALALAAEPHESAEMAAQREAMKNRKRRIIYNNDGCDVFNPGAHTPAGFLAQRMDAVLGSQVDSVFYCTGATVMFSHDAKVGEVYGKYPVEPEWARALPGNIDGLRQAGRDSLGLVVEFCRRHDLEVFYTHRINDIHDSIPNHGFELAAWKRENPKYHISPREEQPKYRGRDPRFWWSSLDFEHAEVRDYLVAVIDDICGRYDIDGYEVDYFRSPMFFKPNLDYKPATAAQVKLLTDFQRRVREVATRHGNRRGRPILVSARVPMTVEKCRHVGIDIEQWLKSDLFDLMSIGGGYVPFTMPTKQLVKLGHEHGKPVYPTISGSGLRGRFRAMAAWRGAAMNAWANGADGIVLFNTFPKARGHPRFHELGDPAKLRDMSKVFAIDNKTIVEGDLAQAIEQDQVIPKDLVPGKSTYVVLPVGDDVAAAARAGRLKSLALHVKVDGLEDTSGIGVRMNGRHVPVLDTMTVPSTTAPGRDGRAYRFTETNILTAGNAPSLQLGEKNFSFSLWIRTTQNIDWSGFIVFVHVPEQTPGVKLYWNAGTLNFSLRAGGREENWNVGGGGRVLDGEWHHYAATFDRQGEAVAWLDGKVVGRHDISGLEASLGARKTLLFGTGDLPFRGLMDDVQLYDRVLSEVEVGRLAAGTAPPDDNLIGRWRFDEATGITFEDSSHNDNHARPYTPGGEKGWVRYAPGPESMKQGDNELDFSSPASGRVTNVELYVEYGR